MRNTTDLTGIFALLFLNAGFILSSVEARAFSYTITVLDQENALSRDRSSVLANLDAAIADWNRYIKSQAHLLIQVEVKKKTGGAGRFSGRSVSNTHHHEENGFHVLEESATYKLRTGNAVKKGEPDLLMEIQPELMRESYWIDPHPSHRTDPVPKGKIDLVTVFAHELGHAFGINGWIDLRSGKLPENKYISQYDSLMLAGTTSGHPTFTGPKTVRIYGGPLPVSFFSGTSTVTLEHKGHFYSGNTSESQNFRHYGRFDVKRSESDLSFFGLMAGVWIHPNSSTGLRIRVGKLDAALLGDLGVPLQDDAMNLNQETLP